MTKSFLQRGNGHQVANGRKAMAMAVERLPGLTIVDERTVNLPEYGDCHFAAYTHEEGAMISTPGRDDNTFGSADWHACGRIMMFRDYHDGRCAIFICPVGHCSISGRSVTMACGGRTSSVWLR